MRGFTIIETVLVIAMLGVLGVTALVMTVPTSPAAVQAAARQIHSDISYAKQNAMMTGVTSGVSFVQNGAYTVYQDTTSTPLPNPQTNTDMIVTLSDKYSDVNIGTTATVSFDKFGAPVSGGGSSITVSDGANSKTITISSNTGMVSIQ